MTPTVSPQFPGHLEARSAPVHLTLGTQKTHQKRNSVRNQKISGQLSKIPKPVFLGQICVDKDTKNFKLLSWRLSLGALTEFSSESKGKKPANATFPQGKTANWAT